MSHGKPSRRYRVLLVDDDPDDIELTRLMLGQAVLDLDVSFVESGAEALTRLRSGRGPDLILLDLNMPVMSGTELLRSLKGDPALRSIPVVILTTSDNPDDKSRTRELGATGYLTKPMGLDAMPPVLKSVEEYLLAPPFTTPAG